jgi:hypothetical protein
MADPIPIKPGRPGPGDPARRPGQPGNQREADPPRKAAAGSPVIISRLREEIDHGVDADKVDFHDPVASPLGTDDEAAGTPPTPERIDLASQQIDLASQQEEPRRDTWARDAARANRAHEGAMRLELWILLAVVMLALLAVIVWWGIP